MRVLARHRPISLHTCCPLLSCLRSRYRHRLNRAHRRRFRSRGRPLHIRRGCAPADWIIAGSSSRSHVLPCRRPHLPGTPGIGRRIGAGSAARAPVPPSGRSAQRATAVAEARRPSPQPPTPPGQWLSRVGRHNRSGRRRSRHASTGGRPSSPPTALAVRRVLAPRESTPLRPGTQTKPRSARSPTRESRSRHFPHDCPHSGTPGGSRASAKTGRRVGDYLALAQGNEVRQGPPAPLAVIRP